MNARNVVAALAVALAAAALAPPAAALECRAGQQLRIAKGDVIVVATVESATGFWGACTFRSSNIQVLWPNLWSLASVEEQNNVNNLLYQSFLYQIRRSGKVRTNLLRLVGTTGSMAWQLTNTHPSNAVQWEENVGNIRPLDTAREPTVTEFDALTRVTSDAITQEHP